MIKIVLDMFFFAYLSLSFSEPLVIDGYLVVRESMIKIVLDIYFYFHIKPRCELILKKSLQISGLWKIQDCFLYTLYCYQNFGQIFDEKPTDFQV